MFNAELNRETVGEQIVQSLRNAIVSGALAERETLTESALSKQLGTSRSPIREAMQQLRREGLIVSGPNRTMIVASLDDSDVAELYEYRALLERFAISKICRFNDEERAVAVRHLDEAIERLKVAIGCSDDFAISTEDLAFHNALIEAAGNRRLSQTYHGLSVEFLMLINRLEAFRPSGDELITDHQKLVDVICEGDAGHGVELIDSHIHSASANLMRDRKKAYKER